MSEGYAVFGGSFDPVHNGHLMLAVYALETLGLERVIFVPAARGPHKSSAPRADAARRTRMLQLALKGEPRFTADACELERGGVSYTIDTVLHFRELFPGEPTLLVGADNLAELNTWRRIGELVELARFACAARPECPVDAGLLPPGLRLETIPMPLCGISSTLLRERAAQGLQLHGMTPPAVADFIRREGLYRA